MLLGNFSNEKGICFNNQLLPRLLSRRYQKSRMQPWALCRTAHILQSTGSGARTRRGGRTHPKVGLSCGRGCRNGWIMWAGTKTTIRSLQHPSAGAQSQGFLPGPPSPHSARAHCSYVKGQKAGLGNCWSQPTCKKKYILLKHILTTAGTWSAATDTRIFLWHYCLADQQGKLVTHQPFLSHPEWFNFKYFQTINKFPSATFLTYFARLSKAF